MAEGQSSLEEMKAMALDLKALRPVQTNIASSLGMSWSDVEKKYGDRVHPSTLRQFIVS